MAAGSSLILMEAAIAAVSKEELHRRADIIQPPALNRLSLEALWWRAWGTELAPGARCGGRRNAGFVRDGWLSSALAVPRPIG
jgi:hypothetical protein